jgi:pimeloyl-ACP methyl ester carboxylesterase
VIPSTEASQLFHRETGSGPAILLVHGMGGSADVWGELPNLLANGHRVIAYDRRGFTRSSHPPVSDPRIHREDAAGLLRSLDAAPAIVVGWSSGGIVALDLAVHHPGLVSGLVLIEPPLHLKRRPGLRQLQAVMSVYARNRMQGDRAASEAFFRWAFRHTSGGTGYDLLDDDVREGLLRNGPANVAELGWGTGEHLTKDDVRSIGCPVTCVTGQLSDRALARATRYLVGLLPYAKVVQVSGAGHAMHLERTPTVASVVRHAVLEAEAGA